MHSSFCEENEEGERKDEGGYQKTISQKLEAPKMTGSSPKVDYMTMQKRSKWNAQYLHNRVPKVTFKGNLF